MEADAARDRFRKIRARFAQPLVQLDFPGALKVKQNGREVEILANGNSEPLLERLKSLSPEELRCRIAVAGGNFRGLGPFEKSQRMNPLVKKEIRLLLPAWIAAMLLAIFPIWIASVWSRVPSEANPYVLLALALGLILLGITSFGQEFSSSTFTLLLSQPIERRRLWFIKTAVLATACISVLLMPVVSWEFSSFHLLFNRLAVLDDFEIRRINGSLRLHITQQRPLGDTPTAPDLGSILDHAFDPSGHHGDVVCHSRIFSLVKSNR